jgi:ADP-heptose:LPS heptosyltransferase
MHVDTMRRIDRWVGVPACYVLTLWRRLTERTVPIDEPVRNVAFIMLAELGALVLAYPAMVRARELFPGAQLHFLTLEPSRAALRLIGISDEQIVTIDPRTPARFAWTTLGAIFEMRRRRIDSVVCLEIFVRFGALLSAVIGARRRSGFYPFSASAPYIGDLFSHRAIYSPHRHIAQSYAVLVEALASPTSDEAVPKRPLAMPQTRFRAVVAHAARQAIGDKLKQALAAWQPETRLVILNANTSDLVPNRRWPTESYAALARRLLEDPRVSIVLTGTDEERTGSDLLRDAIGRCDRVANLAGATTLDQLIALFSVSDLLITNDSGSAHFASGTEIATIVLFGPETPLIFGPVGANQETVYLNLACSPCVSPSNQKRSVCTDNVCMQGISVDAVVDLARRRLAGTSLSPLFAGRGVG